VELFDGSLFPTTFVDFDGLAFVVIIDSEVQVEMGGDRLD